MPVVKKKISKTINVRQALLAMEKRLVTKIDDNTQTFKDYVDIRISLIRDDMQLNTMNIQKSIKQLGDKLDTSVTGLVNLIEQRVGEIIKTQTQLTINN